MVVSASKYSVSDRTFASANKRGGQTVLILAHVSPPDHAQDLCGCASLVIMFLKGHELLLIVQRIKMSG